MKSIKTAHGPAVAAFAALLFALTTISACTSGEESEPAPAKAPAAPQAGLPAAESQPAPAAEIDEEDLDGDLLIFLDIDEDTGGAPFTAVFDVELEGGKPPLTWAWDYGDGQTGSAAETTHRHTFSEPGTYTVELEVTDADGVSDFDLVEIIVE